jgi:Uma2 family endonuclease
MATQVANQLPIHRLDVKTYSQMVESGALDGLPVELVQGLLIDKCGTDPNGGLPIYRLSTDTYNDIVESGALDGRPVELVEGLIVDMMSPHSGSHATVVRRLERHFARVDGWAQVQLPLEVVPDSMLEPDLALLADEPPPGHHPHTAMLTVEVAVSSHKFDRGAKAGMYARAGVPAYWLVDVPGRTVEVRTEPGRDGYGRCEVFREGATVPSPVSGARDLDVEALLAGVGE